MSNSKLKALPKGKDLRASAAELHALSDPKRGVPAKKSVPPKNDAKLLPHLLLGIIILQQGLAKIAAPAMATRIFFALIVLALSRIALCTQGDICYVIGAKSTPSHPPFATGHWARVVSYHHVIT